MSNLLNVGPEPQMLLQLLPARNPLNDHLHEDEKALAVVLA